MVDLVNTGTASLRGFTWLLMTTFDVPHVHVDVWLFNLKKECSPISSWILDKRRRTEVAKHQTPTERVITFPTAMAPDSTTYFLVVLCSVMLFSFGCSQRCMLKPSKDGTRHTRDSSPKCSVVKGYHPYQKHYHAERQLYGSNFPEDVQPKWVVVISVRQYIKSTIGYVTSGQWRPCSCSCQLDISCKRWPHINMKSLPAWHAQ